LNQRASQVGRPAVGTVTRLALAGLATLVVACQRADTPDPGTEARPPLRLTISGLLSPEVIARDAADLNRYFGELWSRPVSVTSVRDPALAATQLAGGQLDAALFSPLRFVIARREVPRLMPMARIVLDGVEFYKGVLVTLRDGGPKSLGALRGKRVCWTSTSSTSGYLYPRALLRERGFDPDEIFSETHFTGSHEESLRALIGEQCDVAATYPVAYTRDFKGAAPDTFIAIAATSPIPYDPLVMSPRLDPAEVATLRAATYTGAKRGLTLPAELELRKLSRYQPASFSNYEEVARVLADELAAHKPEQPF